MISQLFSKSSMQNSLSFAVQAQQIVHGRLLPLLQRTANKPTAEGLDVYSLWQGFAMDTISAYYLGLANSTNFIENAEERETFRKHFLMRTPYAAYMHELPWLMHKLSKMGLHVIPRAYHLAGHALESTVRQWYLKTTEFIKCNPKKLPEDQGNEPLAFRTILSGYDKQSRLESSELGEHVLKNPEPHLLAELMDNLTAAYDTTGITMTYISWQLSKDEEVQNRLRNQLRSLEKPLIIADNDEHRDVPEAKILDSLPLLHAIIMETLRLHCPVLGGQPRIVCKTGVTIGRCPNIPLGTRVAASAYVLHRNSTVFPRPEEWLPERWLDQNPAKLKEMENWFWAFSSGGRMCTGRSFALAELKLLVAAVYTNFQTEIVCDDGIEQMDGHTVGPRASSLWLRFSKAA
ncbi:hypothetical protein PRZ48_012639 [Zasmidium cellare]|uniref:Cytochrome P450 n=1 Tax=Zasmidium cellare TaxID=395010 RepID=A0ABR0E5G3_ZASCE|nr:hypothetical protein PRZ48_012639 [Zasmidium cellare]